MENLFPVRDANRAKQFVAAGDEGQAVTDPGSRMDWSIRFELPLQGTVTCRKTIEMFVVRADQNPIADDDRPHLGCAVESGYADQGDDTYEEGTSMPTATKLGQTGLQGWREKVADGIAEPVARRAPLEPEQVRALLGVVFFVLSVMYVAKTLGAAAREARES